MSELLVAVLGSVVLGLALGVVLLCAPLVVYFALVQTRRHRLFWFLGEMQLAVACFFAVRAGFAAPVFLLGAAGGLASELVGLSLLLRRVRRDHAAQLRGHG